MVKTKDIVTLGRPIQLQERSKAQMKGVTIGDSLAYKFYDGEFHGMSLLFAEPKGKAVSPRSLSVCHSQQSYFAVTASHGILAADMSGL